MYFTKRWIKINKFKINLLTLLLLLSAGMGLLVTYKLIKNFNTASDELYAYKDKYQERNILCREIYEIQEKRISLIRRMDNDTELVLHMERLFEKLNE